MSIVRLNLWARLCVLLSLFVVGAIGCSDDDKTPSACEGVTCDRGICEDSSGFCINPNSCADEADCLSGFECTEDGACDALFPCDTADDCSRGVCFNNACINPDLCDDDGDCIDGYACGSAGNCIDDPCAGVTCDQGVCDQNGECVNSEVCTNATEATDCLTGFVCSGQECVDEATFCSQLECTRGICDFENKECGNAAACSDDTLCVEGFYCDDSGACAPNTCDEQMTTCDRGVCNAADATCVNPETCSVEADCVDGFYCIGSSCESIDDACTVCPGNQTCSYVESTTSVFCAEASGGCYNTADCLDGRICRAGACQPPPACVPDDLEANNDAATATDWNATTLIDGTAPSTICAGDVDFFDFDVDSDVDFTGKLVAIAVFNPEDVGLGELEVELFDPSGTSLGTAVSTGGSARIETTIGNLNRGVYSASVRESGNVNSAGIRYGMFFDVVPEAAVNNCMGATPLAATNTGDTISGGSVSLAGSCVVDRDAPEDVYTFTLNEFQFVSLDLVATSALTMDIRRDCEINSSSVACLPAADDFNEFLSPGTYFVVIQGETLAEAGPYTLNFSAQTPVCAPGESTCMDADTAVVCDPTGTRRESFTCENGCDAAVGRCTATPDDVCYAATDVTAGYADTINLGDFNSDYDPGTSCVGGTSTAATAGPDAAFLVELADGEALLATATPTGYDNVSLYAVRDCDDVSRTCVAGTDANGSRELETLAYANTTGADQSIYVILDISGNETTYDDVDLLINKGTVVCAPGTQQCVGGQQETCNPAGIGYDTVNCSFGCDMQTGACSPPPNDQCGAGAINVSAGGTWMGTIDDYAPDYDPTSSGCTGFTAKGRDAVYQVSGNAGDIVTASLTGDFDLSLYAVTDCSDLTTCLDGDDSGSDEDIRFVLPDTNPVFIVVDAFSTSGTGNFALDVLVETPDCFTPGESIGCADASNLEWCDEYGITRQYACTGACVATTCQNPTGDVCHDPIPLAVGGSFSGAFSDFTSTFDLQPGGCYVGVDIMDGKDAVFSVALSAGETLEATLATTESSAGMYILGNCANVNDSCMWAAPRSKNLEFYAPTAGTYYLVVDSTNSFSSANFSVSLASHYGDVCQPGGGECNDTTGLLTLCSESGNAVDRTISCPNGCNTQFCNPPTTVNDTCTDAFAITGSVVIFDEFDSFTDDYNPGSTGCTGRSETGLDHVYALTLQPNDVVQVDLEVLGLYVDPSAYLVTDCTAVSTSCIWGAASAEPFIVDGYMNDTGVAQTLYLVIDTDSLYDDEQYILDINIGPFECTTGTEVCADSSTRSSCTDYGVFVDENCYFGCAGGQCNAPPNDLCSGAIAAGSGGSFTAPIDFYTDDYNPGSSGCTGSNAPGRDAVYSVNAVQGDVISANLSAGFDGSVYAVTDCAAVDTTCVAGDDRPSGDDSIRFIAPTTGTYYIIADAFTATPTGDFILDISVDTPVCNPGDSVCLDPTTLQVCDAWGLGYNEHTCSTSCSGLACVSPDGDTCFEATDANTVQTYTAVAIDTFTDDYNPTSSGCTGYGEPGPDTAYVLDVIKGDVVEATMTPTFDGSLYAVSDCGDMDSCLAGANGLGTENIQFAAEATGRIFIIADAYSSTATGTFDLTISKTTPVCVANSSVCLDATTAEVCDALGLTNAQITCAYGCMSGSCNGPPNDQCSGAIDATAGGTFMGDYALASDDYSPDDSGICTGYSATGTDLTYSVTLTAGQTVTATLTATDGTNDTSLYIVSDCAGDIEANCLDGDDQYDFVTGNGTGESVTYTATGNETVYIIADNYDGTLSAVTDYSLVVTVQ